MLGHELRNPLASLSDAAQVVRDPSADKTMVARAREIMDRQIQNMSRMVDDLLDVSRITQGQILLRGERLELATIVIRAVELVRHQIEVRGQELSVTLPSEPIYLEADPVRLEQIFGNLLNNASKFTNHGGHIWLAVKREGRGDDTAANANLGDV